MKKKFAVFCAILCLASCFVFPASAASITPIDSIYYPMIYNSTGDVQIGYYDNVGDYSYGNEVQVNNTDFRVTYSNGLNASNYGTGTIGAVSFSIVLDERLLDYSGDQYSLRVSWCTGVLDKSSVSDDVVNNYDLYVYGDSSYGKVFGLTSSSIYKPYKYSDYNVSFDIDQTERNFYNSYTFTGAAMDAALSSDMSFVLPTFISSSSGYIDLEISITTLDGTPVEFPPPKPTLGTGIVASLVDTIGAFLAGVGGNIVAVFNAIVVTETGTLSSFAVWSLVFLGVGLAGGVIAAILRKIG